MSNPWGNSWGVSWGVSWGSAAAEEWRRQPVKKRKSLAKAKATGPMINDPRAMPAPQVTPTNDDDFDWDKVAERRRAQRETERAEAAKQREERAKAAADVADTKKKIEASKLDAIRKGDWLDVRDDIQLAPFADDIDTEEDVIFAAVGEILQQERIVVLEALRIIAQSEGTSDESRALLTAVLAQLADPDQPTKDQHAAPPPAEAAVPIPRRHAAAA